MELRKGISNKFNILHKSAASISISMTTVVLVKGNTYMVFDCYPHGMEHNFADGQSDGWTDRNTDDYRAPAVPMGP